MHIELVIVGFHHQVAILDGFLHFQALWESRFLTIGYPSTRWFYDLLQQ